jgi:hypothetical protein
VRNGDTEIISETKKIGLTHLVNEAGHTFLTAQASGKTLKTINHDQHLLIYNEDAILIHMEGNESNPMLPASPGITYNFYPAFSTAGESISGWCIHDRFPSYEILVNDGFLYARESGPNDTQMNLFPFSFNEIHAGF